MLPRRKFVQYSGGFLLGSSSFCLLVSRAFGGSYDYVLTVSDSKFSLGDHKALKGLAFNNQFPAPIIRGRQGQRLRIKLVNRLKQSTTIHWHGVRLANNMDGVPFLTQKPVEPGGSFIYDFVPPDAGTFWYHPHINSVEQLSLGLTGLLIIDEVKELPFDQDISFQLKNWVIKDKKIKKIFSMRKAARSGSRAPLFTVNGKNIEKIETHPGENIRLRFANLDNSIVYQLSAPELKMGLYLASVDSNPLPDPLPFDGYDLGSGSRIDLIFQPQKAGNYTIYHDGFGKKTPVVDLIVKPVDQPLIKKDTIKLPMNPVAVPDLKSAQTLAFRFEWAGAISPSNPKGAPVFWSINKVAWSGFINGKKPAPLATLKRGASYIFKLTNDTPHRHPIHLHGLFFRVDRSNKKKVRPYFADTVLLDKNETVHVSLVADNPGDWMFHCHIIEHLKTGLMGYIRVT